MILAALPPPIQTLVDVWPLVVTLGGLVAWGVRSVSGQFTRLHSKLDEWRDEARQALHDLDIRVTRLEERDRSS